jgi:predicted amidohydrolase
MRGRGLFFWTFEMSVLPRNEIEGFPSTLVASVQMEPRVGHKSENVARSIAAIEDAANRGAQLVVLPELANSGYVFSGRDEAFYLAEQVPNGPSTDAWAEVARRKNVYVVAGIAERDGDRLYNASVVLGPSGFIGKYRKLHLWGDENLYFEAGDLGLPVFHTPIGRIGVAICYDCWFPEVFRILALKGADMVCVPTNWVPMPGQKSDQLAMANMLAIAAAHSNGLNLICANRVGTERGQPFIGQSLIIGSSGWPLAGPADAVTEQTLIASINLKQSRHAKQLNEFNHVLGDRRLDVYEVAPKGGFDTS